VLPSSRSAGSSTFVVFAVAVAVAIAVVIVTATAVVTAVVAVVTAVVAVVTVAFPVTSSLNVSGDSPSLLFLILGSVFFLKKINHNFIKYNE
jgi:hypothetical protein